MKIYKKPVAKINEYSLIERLANFDTWLSQTRESINIDEDIESYKTSYTVAS